MSAHELAHSLAARGAAVAAGLFVVLASPVQVHLANQIVLAGIAALGLMLLLGAAGLLSLGHAALLGVGGFSVGVLTQEVGAPSWLTLPAAVLAGALLGVLVGLPSLRLRGVYLVLSTLALHFAVVYVGSEYQARRRAASGILVPEPVLGPFTLSDQRVWAGRATGCACADRIAHQKPAAQHGRAAPGRRCGSVSWRRAAWASISRRPSSRRLW